MIGGIFHQGSGIGNQIFRYITTRTVALDKGHGFFMLYVPDGSGKDEGFKGSSFMDIDYGERAPDSFKDFVSFEEKKVVANGVDIRGYDPEINFIGDKTIIDGEFQDERYWGHRLKEIDEWLKVEPYEVNDGTCLIGFRGGEYAVFPDLFLPKEYWDEGIKMMKQINENMSFEIHTDDPQTANMMLPYPAVRDIAVNWRAMRYAKYAVIANSSFYIIPRLLKHMEDPTAVTIAPRYWARHNTKTWALPQNYYKPFTYI